jgi:SulP family sulfate permease
MGGAAILTIVGQVGNALGLKNQGTGHQPIFHRLWLTLTQSAPINPKALTISVGAIVLAVAARAMVRRYRLPQLDMFAVLLVVAIPAYIAGWSQPSGTGKAAVSLIEAVPASLPTLHIPEIKWVWFGQLSSSAFAIAILGLLETLAIAKAIAYKTRQTLDFNRQCLAEGVGNLAGAFFRSMPGAGSLSRSAINHQAGAATRVSGVFTAVLVAIMVLLLAPLTRYIPKAALAGLLIVAASRLIDIPRMRYIARASRYDAILLWATALAALVIGVEFAILIGVTVSISLFVPRAARIKVAELVVTDERIVRERLITDPHCTAVHIHDLEGELFFGSAPELEHHLENAVRAARKQQVEHIVLRLKRLRNPDAVCLERLEHFLRDTQAEGLTILLAGVRPDLLNSIERLKFRDWFPPTQIFAEEDDIDSATLKAVRKAYDMLGARNDCQHCAAYASPARRRAAYYLV